MRKFSRNDFPAPVRPKNHRVGHVPVMEVQVIRRVVVGLKHGEIFLPEMLVARSPVWSVKRNEKSA